MGEWPTKPLGEVVDEILDRRGVTPLKLGSDFTVRGHRVISAKLIKGRTVDLTADEARFVDAATYCRWMRVPLAADDVILTSEAPLGEVAYLATDVDWVLGQRLFAIRTDKRQLHGRYLYYALQADPTRSELLSRATGTTAQGIRQSELRHVRVPLPALSVQRRIAEILGALDDKIELNRRMSETLEATARALFKSWFVDFDSDRAGSRLDSRVGSLLDVADLLSGGTPRTDQAEYWGGDIRWASAKDVSECSGPFLVDTERQITPRGLVESPTQMIPALSSVVVARGATTGRLAILGESMAMNQTCYALTSHDGTPFWLYLQLRHVMAELVHSAHGSVFDTITTTTFASAMFSLPFDSRRRAFEDLVDPVFRRVLACAREARTLAAMRDALLPRLISGELRLKDADHLVESVSA